MQHLLIPARATSAHRFLAVSTALHCLTIYCNTWTRYTDAVLLQWVLDHNRISLLCDMAGVDMSYHTGLLHSQMLLHLA